MAVSSLKNNCTSSSVGIFDSGVGGLSILDKIHQLLPNENLLYLADSAHAPYGQKDEGYIQERCQKIMEFFIEQKVKAVVLACNTATAAAVAILRENYSLPIIGMEPAIKPAAEKSPAGIIGVLATAGTIDSDKFVHLKSQYAEEVEIITKACPGLVEEIEQTVQDQQAIVELLQKYALPLIEKGADTLVLGCTHYSLITGLIKEVVGTQIEIVDTGFAVAMELQRRLQERKIENSENGAVLKFYSSGNIQTQEALIRSNWSESVQVLAFS